MVTTPHCGLSKEDFFSGLDSTGLIMIGSESRPTPSLCNVISLSSILSRANHPFNHRPLPPRSCTGTTCVFALNSKKIKYHKAKELTYQQRKKEKRFET